MSSYNKIAELVDKVKNARFGEMVNYVEALIDAGWQDFNTPTGTRFQFKPAEFDYFLIAMDVDPTVIRHAYCYAPDVENLAAKELRLADITGRGRFKESNRRPWQEVADALASDPSGSGARINAVYSDGGSQRMANWFVTGPVAKMAKNPEFRSGVKRGSELYRQPTNRWGVRWSDDKTTAQAIVEKLLADDELAREVYKRLHSHYVANAAKQKRRSDG